MQFYTSNLDAHDQPEATFVLSNDGIGPARIEHFELAYDRRPVRDVKQLLQACCQQQAQPGLLVVTSTVVGRILAARDRINLLLLRRTEENAPVWDRLDEAREKISVRACYCSVFDECWVIGSEQPKPKRVAGECPTNRVDWTQSPDRDHRSRYAVSREQTP